MRNGNGNPTSEALRLVERFALSDLDTLHDRGDGRGSADVAKTLDRGVPAETGCGLRDVR